MSRSYILGKLTGGSLIFSEFAFKKCIKWGKNNAQPRANCSPLLRQDPSVHSPQCKGLWIKVCKPVWVPGTVTYKPLGSLPPALGSFLTHALISMKRNTRWRPSADLQSTALSLVPWPANEHLFNFLSLSSDSSCGAHQFLIFPSTYATSWKFFQSMKLDMKLLDHFQDSPILFFLRDQYPLLPNAEYLKNYCVIKSVSCFRQ